MLAATLILPALAYADRDNDDHRGGDRDRDDHIPAVPEANAGVGEYRTIGMTA